MIFIGGTAEVFTINSGLGIDAVIIGVIILCAGLIRSKNVKAEVHKQQNMTKYWEIFDALEKRAEIVGNWNA